MFNLKILNRQVKSGTIVEYTHQNSDSSSMAVEVNTLTCMFHNSEYVSKANKCYLNIKTYSNATKRISHKKL